MACGQYLRVMSSNWRRPGVKGGEELRGFSAGLTVDDTLAIPLVPPRRVSPQSDLLEHYFSMTLSKCYEEAEEQAQLHHVP
jgi:hypothetical protein